MTPAEGADTARFPSRFLTVIVIVTGLVLVWLGWGAYRSYDAARATRQRDFRIEQLRGTIVHLDEVLTMSARMAVATGEPRWEERYRRYEPQLDASIKEAMALSPEAAASEAATQTDTANLKLVQMENRAFALVRENRLADARAVLFSGEYETQKQVYAEGMQRLADLLGNTADATLQAEYKRAYASVVSATVVISALLVAWLLVLGTLRRWRAALLQTNRQLAQQAEELAELNRALDLKVAERTRELEASRTVALARLKEAEEARGKAEQAEEAVLGEKRLLRELLHLQDRDRKLVAYEIHDGFVQQVTGALMYFQAYGPLRERDPDEAQRVFDRGIESLREGIAEARRLIEGLRPLILEESGVVPAIDSLVSENRQRGDREIEFHHDVQFDRLPPPLESALFRMVQECLNNACRHSRSNKIRIGLLQEGDWVKVEVQDWGIGFDPGKVGQGRYGLQGIRERARLLRGRVTVESAPGRGTRIAVELPLVQIDSDAGSDTTVGTKERLPTTPG